ncbi:hypothetical protein BD414DRAFT_523114 [Trametes punicea]|nr:hypothetical protein BD414DRAFT_523114 [Trametes punicea]
MSLASLAKRLRGSRTKSGNVSSSSSKPSKDGSTSSNPPRAASAKASLSEQTSQDASHSEIPITSPLAISASSNKPASVAMPVPSPAALSIQQPLVTMPEPSPAAPTAPLHAMDGALSALSVSNILLTTGPAVPRGEKALDTMGDKIDALVGQANKAMSVVNNVSPIANALEKTDIAQKIERGIQRFVDDIPWLMRGLDELARIHPAVTVAVLAFKAVYALETTRQENDRRVITLYVEMKDMMMVMVQLRNVEKQTHIGLDGRVLKDRLEELAEKTAKDIKDCANFCDTFLKKRLLVKVLKGPVWAEKLSGYVKTFTDRKSDFQFALSMHTANSLTDVKRQTYEIDAKIDVVIALFNRFLSAEERRLAEEVERNGGAAKVRQNDDYLKSLIALDITVRRGGDKEPQQGAPSAREKATGRKRESVGGTRDTRAEAKDPVSKAREGTKVEASITLEDLKWELREDIDEALERNLETFLGKFELQVSMLQVALERYIREENDRIIGAVTDVVTHGPHLKIKDLELRKIWQDMNWRGHVKARLLLMTLRDYYRDVIEDARLASEERQIINDEWTLEYLGPSWFQPLLDVLDDDASGYITIAEVNKLMDQRPAALNWSIPRWLAYWAVGWRAGAALYATRVKRMLGGIRDSLSRVLPLNRSAVDNYLGLMLSPMFKVVLAIQWDREWIMEGHFEDYFEHEEQRIRSNLQRVKYRIDAFETVHLVLGPGRLEKSILPLLYLLLENDYRKIQAAQSVVIAEFEFKNSGSTMSEVFEAIASRCRELKNMFEYQNLDLDAQFEKHAWGLFHFQHFENRFWHTDNVTSSLFHTDSDYCHSEVDRSDIEEDKKITDGAEVYDAMDEDNEEDLLALMPVKQVLGLWNGFLYDNYTYPTHAMLSLRFHHSGKEDEDFTASGTDFDGQVYRISGECSVDEEGYTTADWSMQFSGDYTFYFKGRLQDEYTLLGQRGYTTDYYDRSFVLKKIPAEFMCLRPSPFIFSTKEKARELWRYAISAVVCDLRRRNWSWSFFAERRNVRKQYVKCFARWYGRSFWVAEELSDLRQRCTLKDARFYQALVERRNRILPTHTDCSGCGSTIGGARVICLDCVPDPSRFDKIVALCDDPWCLDSTIAYIRPSGISHDSSHDFLKVRTVLHDVYIPAAFEMAKDGLARWREADIVPPDPPAVEDADVDQEPGAQSGGNARQVEPEGDALSASQLESDQASSRRQPSDSERLAATDVAPTVNGSTAAGLPDILGSTEPSSPTADLKSVHADLEDAPPVEPENTEVEADETDPAHLLCKCKICQKTVYMGRCWWCLECEDYVCDDCDAQLLIFCHWCRKPFRQPQWYWGRSYSDFICAVCSAQGVIEQTDYSLVPSTSHVTTHMLVKCKRKANSATEGDAVEMEPSSEERLVSLEERMAAMDSKLEQLQSHLVQLEHTIVSRLDEALRMVSPSIGNGHALVNQL